ncbi:MAG: hypothetical protein U5R31_03770 [Acidimicrobiia bacterium]|nr:hypothetical protein [Acidimicrobiia bacterium]
MEHSTAELVELGDLDELIRQVDRLCDRRAWDELLELRDRSRQAFERGHQLWPAASLAEYRLALDAPADVAAGMLVGDTGRFTLGPLPEVVAQHHRWHDLAPHAPPGAPATVAAFERVVHGEAVDDGTVDTHMFDLPLALQEWEPDYPLAAYRPDRAEFPAPDADARAGGHPRAGSGPDRRRGRVGPAGPACACGPPNPTATRAPSPSRVVRPTRSRCWKSASRASSNSPPVTPSLCWRGSGRAAGPGGGVGAWPRDASRRGGWPRPSPVWPRRGHHPPTSSARRAGSCAGTGGTRAAQTGWTCRLAVEDPLDGLAWALDATDESETPSRRVLAHDPPR